MTTLPRTDTSLIGRWWWTVDRWMLMAIFSIASIGALLTLAASPAVAERIGFGTYYFVHRQFIFLPVSLMVMVLVSFMTPRGIIRLAVGCAGIAFLGMIATLFGEETNGARRWIHFADFSLQPSEFIKPAFAIIVAWLFAESRYNPRFSGNKLATIFFISIVILLLLQPDVGMTSVVAAIWGIEFFLAGLPLFLVVLVAVLFIGGFIVAYFTFGHVQTRIDSFLDPASEAGGQVARAMEAFSHGGLFGRGPGEGRVKEVLPDAHTDFIFAVAGEEFGLIACLVVVGLFASIVFRGFSRALRENDLFILLASAGLIVQFGLQVIINLASTLNMIPPKGMTLPFVSYGGSSILALAIGMGMLLALTRERSSGLGLKRIRSSKISGAGLLEKLAPRGVR